MFAQELQALAGTGQRRQIGGQRVQPASTGQQVSGARLGPVSRAARIELVEKARGQCRVQCVAGMSQTGRANRCDAPLQSELRESLQLRGGHAFGEEMNVVEPYQAIAVGVVRDAVHTGQSESVSRAEGASVRAERVQSKGCGA